MMSQPDHDAADDTLDAAVARLPRTLQPERDLWPDIAAALPPRRQPRLAGWLSVAVIAFAGVIGWHVMFRTPAIEGEDVAVGPRSAWLRESRVPAGLPVEYAAAEAAFRRVREERYGDVEARLDRLPPESREAVERSLVTIAGAIAELQEALAEEPVDPVLQDLLWSLYTQELAVLGQVNQATRFAETERIEI